MKSMVLVFLFAAVAFQLWVSYRVIRSQTYEREQKSAQLGFIWMLPALGAIITFMVLRDAESSWSSPQRNQQDQR